MKTNSLSNAGMIDTDPAPVAARRSRGGFLYLVLWLLLAAGALVYLSALVLAPGQLMALFGSPKDPIAESNEVAAANAPTTTELQDEISRLEISIEQMQGEMRTLVATNQSLTDRLETIENASIQVQGDEAKAVNVAQKKAKTGDAPEDSEITGLVIGADGVGGEDIAADEPTPAAKADKKKKSDERLAQESQDAVGQLADASSEQAPKAEKRKFGLELAVSTSPEALQLNWDLLNERHGELLKGLSARAQPSPDDPSSYRLVTGPFTTAQQAQSVCAKLKKKNVACQVTGFGGDNL